MATPTSSAARPGAASQMARAAAARGQAISPDMLEGEGGRRPGDKGAPGKKGLPLMLIIIVVVVVLPLVLGAYVMLAPYTMWKPLYVRLEMEDAATPVAGEAVPSEAAAAAVPVESHAPEHGQLQPLHPPTTVAAATAPPLRPPGPGVMYQLGTKVVNLADPGGLRYLQVSLVLELHPELNAYLAEIDAASTMAPAESEHAAADSGHGETAAAETGGVASTLDARRPIIDDVVMTTLSSKRYNDISTIKGKQALKEELILAVNEALGVPGVLNIYFTEFVVQ